MQKQTLSSIFEGKLFQIPDYQRGYAWGTKQWKDFVQDIDALIDEDIQSHYTGTIVLYKDNKTPQEQYGTKKLNVVDVVDGQQRLTSCCLYLAVILKKLAQIDEDYKAEIGNYLYSKSKSRLILNNDTNDFFFDLIKKGNPNVKVQSVHQERLLTGYNYFEKHIEEQLRERDVESYLRNLFETIVGRLNFTSYFIEKESEIGMTFELMNSRGKELSSLELLKNYLMYWIYRNTENNNDKNELTTTINKSWKEVYTNVSACNGDEERCLRIAWTLYCSHNPKQWKGYNGFKADDYIPLRNFSLSKSKVDTQKFIELFVNGLAIVSKHYAKIECPDRDSEIKAEYLWLTKIKNTGNIATYLPLLVASRILAEKDKSNISDYIELLKAIEKFSYRVFLWSGKRSNTGLSKFYRWAYDVYSEKHTISEVKIWILGTINYYNDENYFRNNLENDLFNWYRLRRLLKYTLFEYEVYLLAQEGKGQQPRIAWKDLTDSTIEHILPQTPTEEWKSHWSDEDISKYQHNIANLILTKNNSHYLNFTFERKKGNAGKGYCYANSDIRQERKIASFNDWTVESCERRRKELVNWIVERWGIDGNYIIPQEIQYIEEDEDEI